MKKTLKFSLLVSVLALAVSCSKVDPPKPASEPEDNSIVPTVAYTGCPSCPITIYGPDVTPLPGELKRCAQTNVNLACYVVKDVSDGGSENSLEVDLYNPLGTTVTSTLYGYLSSYTSSSVMTIQGTEYTYYLNNGVISAIYSVE